MKVLIDFDNVPVAIRNQGPVYLADLILTKLAPELPTDCRSLELRLYSGWDENGRLTKRAQDLSALLPSKFPKLFKTLHTDPPTPVMIRAGLAQSLECAPKKLFSKTMRTMPFSKHVTCLRPSAVACRNANCPIEAVAVFLNSESCPVAGCRTTPSALISATEQKLVDSMLTADLIHLAHSGEQSVAIVSSDDDMWPGIITAVHAGIHVLHIQTAGLQQSLPYLHVMNGKYTQVGL